MTVIYILIGMVIGILLACAIWMLACEQWFVGTLREDRSIPEDPPYWFMEILRGREKHLTKNRFALLRIRRENYRSGKGA